MKRVTHGLIARLLMASTLSVGGCGNPVEPHADVSGRWVEPLAIPGASFSIDLTQRGNGISGTGRYSIEAGPSGTLTVTGSYSLPSITLTFEYDYGMRLTFSGTVDRDTMVGTLTDRTGQSTGGVRLVRQ